MLNNFYGLRIVRHYVEKTTYCVIVLLLLYLFNQFITLIIEQHGVRNIKLVLLWTRPNSTCLQDLENENVFLERKCKWNNCYVTSDRSLLGDLGVTEFHAVVFHGPQLMQILNESYIDLPLRRSPYQKYVYANFEAAAKYPTDENFWNGFFNFTWTYKLDSDSKWGYLAIRNASQHVIGPSQNINWRKMLDMYYVEEDFIQRIKNKTKAVAWFPKNCITLSKREYLVMQINNELRHYGLKVDIFGKCGHLKCPQNSFARCLEILESSYYFYLAFEEAVDEDYVTEELLLPLNHNTVPIVYGGANYSRFMPKDIYIDASQLNPKEIASKINAIMQFPQTHYYHLFKWKNHYSYHHVNESSETDNLCQFCAVLNDKNVMEKEKVWSHLWSWWKPEEMQKHQRKFL